jgi:PPM family protein phosphatase
MSQSNEFGYEFRSRQDVEPPMVRRFAACAGVSDVGRRRKNNEDRFFCLEVHGIFCVADGIGGSDEGEIASRMLEDSFREIFAPHDGKVLSLSSKQVLLQKAVHDAAARISRRARERHLSKGCGTTLAALLMDAANPGRAVAAHAGDSRVYLYGDHGLRCVTIDHSLAVEAGMKAEELPRQFRNIVTRSIGLDRAVEVQFTPMDLKRNHLVLLCTDGLTGMLANDRIASILKNQESTLSLEDRAQMLVHAANEAGGKDNVTVLLVDLKTQAGQPLEVEELEGAIAQSSPIEFKPDTQSTPDVFYSHGTLQGSSPTAATQEMKDAAIHSKGIETILKNWRFRLIMVFSLVLAIVFWRWLDKPQCTIEEQRPSIDESRRYVNHVADNESAIIEAPPARVNFTITEQPLTAVAPVAHLNGVADEPAPQAEKEPILIDHAANDPLSKIAHANDLTAGTPRNERHFSDGFGDVNSATSIPTFLPKMAIQPTETGLSAQSDLETPKDHMAPIVQQEVQEVESESDRSEVVPALFKYTEREDDQSIEDKRLIYPPTRRDVFANATHWQADPSTIIGRRSIPGAAENKRMLAWESFRGSGDPFPIMQPSDLSDYVESGGKINHFDVLLSFYCWHLCSETVKNEALDPLFHTPRLGKAFRQSIALYETLSEQEKLYFHYLLDHVMQDRYAAVSISIVLGRHSESGTSPRRWLPRPLQEIVCCCGGVGADWIQAVPILVFDHVSL